MDDSDLTITEVANVVMGAINSSIGSIMGEDVKKKVKAKKK
jgi:hypothetical protein